MIFMFSLHGAAVPSGQLDFGGAGVFKVFRVISPAVLIKLDYTIILQKQINFMQMIYDVCILYTYLCFDIESVLALVAEEDENAQWLPNLGDALKRPGLQYIIYMICYI